MIVQVKPSFLQDLRARDKICSKKALFLVKKNWSILSRITEYDRPQATIFKLHNVCWQPSCKLKCLFCSTQEVVGNKILKKKATFPAKNLPWLNFSFYRLRQTFWQQRFYRTCFQSCSKRSQLTLERVNFVLGRLEV